MLEYALMASLIALVCIIGVSSVGFGAANKFNEVRIAMPSGTFIPDGLPKAPAN
jgi:Flp pilus assembly pilin Flp